MSLTSCDKRETRIIWPALDSKKASAQAFPRSLLESMCAFCDQLFAPQAAEECGNVPCSHRGRMCRKGFSWEFMNCLRTVLMRSRLEGAEIQSHLISYLFDTHPHIRKTIKEESFDVARA